MSVGREIDALSMSFESGSNSPSAISASKRPNNLDRTNAMG